MRERAYLNDFYNCTVFQAHESRRVGRQPTKQRLSITGRQDGPVWLVTLLLLSAATWSEGGRVVVLPMPFTSHARYQIHVARALVKLGHEV